MQRITDAEPSISIIMRQLGMKESLGGLLQMVYFSGLLLGTLLGVVGTAAGLGLGVGACWVLDRFELVPLPGDVFFVDHVPFLVRPGDLGAILAITLGLAVGVSLYAARRAGTLAPAEALRR